MDRDEGGGIETEEGLRGFREGNGKLGGSEREEKLKGKKVGGGK
jgi:hypothetical protein